MMKTAEKASMLSIYLVGFQLPLSGAMLALPDLVGNITRPFISAYWAWSGSLQNLETGYYDAVKDVTQTPINSGTDICLFILITQIFVGIAISYIGIKKHQWEH